MHRSGRVLAHAGREAREEAAALLGRPVAQRAHLHVLDAERRQHVARRSRAAPARTPRRACAGVDRRILVGEVGDAVQRDGGLARAGGAADRDEARRGPRDQRELLGVDQARDVGEALVGAARAAARIGAEPPLPALARGVDAQRRALAAREARRLARDLQPAAVRVGDEAPLRRVDARERGAADRDGAPRHHLAGHDAAADLLLVVLALLVAVVEPRDRRVPPVDDAHAVLEAGRLAEAEVALAPVLAQAQVGEVRRGGVDARRGARLAELRAQRGQHAPALVQRRALEVVDAAAQQLIADVLELLDDRGLGRRLAVRRAGDAVVHAFEQRELLGDDPIRQSPLHQLPAPAGNAPLLARGNLRL